MKAVDSDKFEISMAEELDKMWENDIYEIIKKVDVREGHSILRSVWSHRRKTTPDGNIYRHRSRLCADGSTQKYGLDYNETYSPVVMWSTLRTLFILGKVLGWSSRKVDYVQAFPQAELDENEHIYMHLPRGLHVDDAKHRSDYVLKLKKNLYGLKQASYNWSELLKSGLIQLGFTQSKVDPCLYFKDDVICAIYVDDTIFWSPDDTKIDQTITELKALNFDLTDEGEVDSFLGIKIETTDDNTITMSQPALTDTIIKTLGLEKDSKQHKTPAVSPPLNKHKDSKPFNEEWSYRSLIGMLTYLARNTRPDIEYAVHQCARFQCDPRLPHANAIKRIGRYLIGTRDKGLTFKPSNDLSHFECYVDADFAGNYTAETCEDPNSVKSRTGCVIKYAGCPITWFSRLQTEIALSTTEAEYIALSTAAREVLPLRELILEIKPILNIPEAKLQIRCTLFEDNKGAEELAKVPKNRPRTKHIAVKYHHFRQAVKDKILLVKRIGTEEQLADIFTKPLARLPLEHLRKQIMGWPAMLSHGTPIPIHGYETEEVFSAYVACAMH